MYRISNQEFSIKCIWKFVSLDKNPLLRGWKLLEFKWQLKWGNETVLRLANQTTKVNKWYRHHPRHSFLNLFIDLFYVHLGACIHYKLVLLLQWPSWKVALNALFSTGRQIASHADVLRCPSRVPASRTSAEPKDKFLSHCSQVSAGDHMQIIGDPIGAVEVKVLTSQTHTYKLGRVWYVTKDFCSGRESRR